MQSSLLQSAHRKPGHEMTSDGNIYHRSDDPSNKTRLSVIYHKLQNSFENWSFNVTELFGHCYTPLNTVGHEDLPCEE